MMTTLGIVVLMVERCMYSVKTTYFYLFEKFLPSPSMDGDNLMGVGKGVVKLLWQV
ncbi:unnamed protein product [Trifolium pratense]|uniref:Uncharacterized protein n=1 Tax=Trifolium pratense TaxID=57577 RepID=A0ACB0KFQ8_TRIPR|nr:unnamed protein product [Trifolium pratense]